MTKQNLIKEKFKLLLTKENRHEMLSLKCLFGQVCEHINWLTNRNRTLIIENVEMYNAYKGLLRGVKRLAADKQSLLKEVDYLHKVIDGLKAQQEEKEVK